MDRPGKRDAGPFAAAAALLAAVFALDAMVPPGVGAAVAYVAAVAVARWIAWRPAAFVIAGLASLLTVAGSLAAPAGGEIWQAFGNLGLALFAIWTTAFLVHAGRRAAGTAPHDARLAAERANAAKSRFLAAASHDLRQPLYALRLFLGTLEERLGDPEYADLIEKMAQSLDSADRLLTTVLDLSRLEAGAVAPRLADFPVRSVLDPIAAEFTPLAQARNNRLRVVPCSAWVRSDRALLESILRNLVANAVRYTAGGRILVGCRRRSGRVRFEVRDTGVGIPADKQALVFEEFQRLDQPAADSPPGLGLGLAIVDRTARLLGYRIELRSQPGRGSVFAFEVPRDEPGRPAQAIRS